MNEDMNIFYRMDTRLFTRFPSTYHLRTLFDEYVSFFLFISIRSESNNYQSTNISDASEGSEIGDAQECQIPDRLEIIAEDEYLEGRLQSELSLNESRKITEKSDGVMNINSNRSSLNMSSGSNTNRSKQSKKNKRRSYRR